MKSDDAVSPVVAMMLILAVVVICVSIMSASYVPDLKENAEIMHSKEVKEKFLEFASDVENIYVSGRSGVHSYVIPLGGGDILLSPSRSSGSLSVDVEDVPFGTIIIEEANTTHTFSPNSIKVTYNPVLSFWENQGYKYEKGIVFVTKNGTEVPALANYRQTEVNEILEKMKPEPIQEIWVNDIHGTYKKRYYAMNIIIFNAGNKYISGSSDALLKIEAVKELHTYVIPAEKSITLQGENGYEICLTNPADYEPAEVTVTIITATVSVA